MPCLLQTSERLRRRLQRRRPRWQRLRRGPEIFDGDGARTRGSSALPKFLRPINPSKEASSGNVEGKAEREGGLHPTATTASHRSPSPVPPDGGSWPTCTA